MIGACWLSQASTAAQVSGLSGIFIVSVPLAGAEMKKPSARAGPGMGAGTALQGGPRSPQRYAPPAETKKPSTMAGLFMTRYAPESNQVRA